MSVGEPKLEPSGDDPTKDAYHSNFLLERTIQVTGIAESEILPDRAKIAISVSSCKVNAEDTIKSVNKRVEYITQSLMLHGAKEEDINTTESLVHQESGTFLMQVDFEVVFKKPKDCQTAAIHLLQKLDATVKVSTPVFFHSFSSQETMRTRVTVDAVKNALQKASEMSSILGMIVGEPLSITEESCTILARTESTNPRNILLPNSAPLRQQYAEATLIVESVVSVKFKLKSKTLVKAHHQSKKAKKLV